jgi:hypothetical protein
MTMTTLLHLNQTLLDVQETLAREKRFGHDTCHNLLNGTKLLREAIDNLERDIKTYFEERDRSISCVLGNSQPYTTLIDQIGEAASIGSKKTASAESKKPAASAD